MEQKKNSIVRLLNALPKKVWMVGFSIIMLFILGALILVYVNEGNFLALKTDNKINITPSQIESIRNIGQWEFLSISDEELIDTVRHGFFGDDHLVRIYYGTLRLGVDLHEADKKFIKVEGDSIRVLLPPIKLLDDNFIDEARTKSFYETGKWSGKDREGLYNKAYRAMIKRCMKTENIKSAEENASRQLYNFMKSMGFEQVKIRWDQTKK